MVSRDIFPKAGKRGSAAAAAAHRRRAAETDRLLAASDVHVARREHVIERVRRGLAAAGRAA